MKLLKKSIQATILSSIIGFSSFSMIYSPMFTVQAEEEENIEEEILDEEMQMQVNFVCIMPENFNLAGMVEFVNDDTGETYEIISTAINNHQGFTNCPAGSYTITKCMVYDDENNKFPMIMPENFTIEPGQNYTIKSTLENFDEIQNRAENRIEDNQTGESLKWDYDEEQDLLNQNSEETSETESDNSLFTFYEQEEIIYPWREVTHLGNGSGEIRIEGNCDVLMDVIIKITKSGTQKKGEYIYSTDNGNTWSDAFVIKSKNNINMTDTEYWGNDFPSGLCMIFDENEYIKGDTYSISTIYEYPVNSITENTGKNVLYVSTDEIPIGDTHFGIKITQSGSAGEATFSYCTDYDEKTYIGKNWSEPITIPKEGSYTFEDYGYDLVFYPINDDIFYVGDVYYYFIDGTDIQKDFTSYYIWFAGIVAAILGIFGYSLISKKDKLTEYQLNRYSKVTVENVTKKK